MEPPGSRLAVVSCRVLSPVCMLAAQRAAATPRHSGSPCRQTRTGMGGREDSSLLSFLSFLNVRRGFPQRKRYGPLPPGRMHDARTRPGWMSQAHPTVERSQDGIHRARRERIFDGGSSGDRRLALTASGAGPIRRLPFSRGPSIAKESRTAPRMKPFDGLDSKVHTLSGGCGTEAGLCGLSPSKSTLPPMIS